MVPTPSRRSNVPGLRWSLVAGLYTFVCGAALLSLLSPVTGTLASVLGLPPGNAVPLLAAPVVGIGPVVWWAVVERGGDTTYARAALAGLAISLSTTLLWLVVGAVVWGLRLVLVGGVVVLFVLAVTVPVGVVAGIPLMFARRRLG